MAKFVPKKPFKKAAPPKTGASTPAKLPEAFQRNIQRAKDAAARGESINPAGRPKGSRNRFAEEFIKDFLADWEAHGTNTLARCRAVDPAAYLKVAVTLIPKDVNLNLFKGAELEKLLEQFDDKQLSNLLTGLVAAGAGGTADPAPTEPRAVSDKLH